MSAAIDGQKVAVAIREFNSFQPDLIKQLRRDLRGELKPLARYMAEAYPKTIDLSGYRMAHGTHGVGTVRGAVGVLTRRGRGTTALVQVRMVYNNATVNIWEKIGKRNPGISPQGKHLYQEIQNRFPGWPKGGRIFYKAFQSGPRVMDNVRSILNDFMTKVDRKF